MQASILRQKIIKSIQPSLAILLFYLGTSLLAEGQLQQLKNVVPPSPNVASLGKYGEIPVGLYTGVPEISIPLYEIKNGDLTLPISLSYHAAGVKVEEVPSPVGLGWSLNAGGVLGKSVRGQDDEVFQWRNRPVNERIETWQQNTSTPDFNQFVRDVNLGTKDGEADIYYYNFNNYSGKFFFDQTGASHTVPARNFLINPPEIQLGWEVKTEDGSIYTFQKQEEVSSANCSSAGDYTTYTAWYLTSIKSADGKREITFTYESAVYTYQNLVGQVKYFSVNGTGSSCMPAEPPCLGTQHYVTHRLTRIDFGEGYLKFLYNNVRCDLVDDKSLDVVEIYNKTDVLLKKYNLAYSYFGNNSDGVNRWTENNKRLKLLSITEQNSTQQKPPYLFEYNESIELPSRQSYAQDHWGYYNGQIANFDLIASFKTVVFSGTEVIVPGAERKANALTTQAAILKKIKYPTGGETLFTYENNTVSDGSSDPQVTYQDIGLNWSGTVDNMPNPYNSFTTLTIPAGGAEVEYIVSGIESWPWQSCDITQCYLIKDNNPTPYRQLINSLNHFKEVLPAGTYSLRFVWECGIGAAANFNVAVVAAIPVVPSSGIRTVGGLRVTQIEDKPGNGQQSVIKNFRYEKVSDAAQSSGYLVNYPDYGYDLSVFSYAGGTSTNCSYRVRQSFSNSPLATTKGSYVGYDHVIVDHGQNGESRHTFVAYSDPTPTFPFPPVENFDWRRGFETGSIDYAKKNGQLVKVREIINTPTGFNEFTIYGLKVGRNLIKIRDGIFDLEQNQDQPVYTFYPTKTEFHAPGKTVVKTYDQNDPTKYIEQVTDHTYNTQHLQLSQSRTVTSNTDAVIWDEIVTNKKYPFDYTFSGTPSGTEALGIKKLKDLHVVNVPVEEYMVRQKRNSSTNAVSDQRVVGGAITTFKSDNPYPDQVYRLETNTTIPLSTYGTGSGISGNAFIKNTNSTVSNTYKSAVVFNNYDTYGNLTQQQKTNDVINTYIWGYDKLYPIAEVINAESKDVFHTSFEDPNGNSNAGDSKTGSQSRTNGFSTSLSNLTNGNYSLTYWQKNGANWTLQSSTVAVTAGSYTINLTGQVDEVRFYPEKALMTTYTRTPLIGMTSKADANNRINYYQYDGFGRLALIRDQDNNIVKKICYNYKGQVEDCSSPCITTSPFWQNTETGLRCQQNSCGNTGYLEQEQKDMNPCSPTYNQLQWVTTVNNIIACPSSSVPLTYQNTPGASGYTAKYTNTVTGIVYTFAIPAGSGNLGCVPSGTYTINISKKNSLIVWLFGCGCFTAVGTSATFNNVNVTASSHCNNISIDVAD